ncbi:MAG: hypothetical protein RL839_06570 [Gammaproteobacteria bacterium]|jgi:hypothetical protein
MASKTKNRQPFDQRGGVIALGRHFLESQQYLGLSAQAKVLITLMQVHWRPHEPVGYGIREAMKRIPCAKGTAQRAFKELEEKGFIVKVDESLFNSRFMSKSRTWRLTWMPYNFKPPTNNWEK